MIEGSAVDFFLTSPYDGDMENEMKTRNHVARNAWRVNKPKVFKARKGKGSFVRLKRVDLRVV